METTSYLLGKKAGGGSGGTTNYNELSNKPSINGIELSGNKSTSQLDIYEKITTSEIDNILNPSPVEDYIIDLDNDYEYIDNEGNTYYQSLSSETASELYSIMSEIEDGGSIPCQVILSGETIVEGDLYRDSTGQGNIYGYIQDTQETYVTDITIKNNRILITDF